MGFDELGQEPLTTSMLACAGCGKDLSDKESDHRDLHKSQAARALQGWRSLLKYFEQENKKSDILKRGEKMCRNCFSAYGRYHDLQTTLLAGLKNSLYAVESSIGEGIVPLRSTLSQRKRPHGESSSPTSSKRLHRGSGYRYSPGKGSPAKGSPSVTVS